VPAGVTPIVCRPEPQGWSCAVTLSDDQGTSSHRVRVTRRDLERLAPGSTTPDDLVRRSFEFLLARESRESILRSFDLPLIGRYFPEYEAAMIERDV
jgi:hypothetical protein